MNHVTSSTWSSSVAEFFVSRCSGGDILWNLGHNKTSKFHETAKLAKSDRPRKLSPRSPASTPRLIHKNILCLKWFCYEKTWQKDWRQQGRAMILMNKEDCTEHWALVLCPQYNNTQTSWIIVKASLLPNQINYYISSTLNYFPLPYYVILSVNVAKVELRSILAKIT